MKVESASVHSKTIKNPNQPLTLHFENESDLKLFQDFVAKHGYKPENYTADTPDGAKIMGEIVKNKIAGSGANSSGSNSITMTKAEWHNLFVYG